jgi:hypothetical protein
MRRPADRGTPRARAKNPKSIFMNYSLEKVSTVQGSDMLLAMAQKKKENLERRRRNLAEEITMFNERASNVARELASVEVLIQTFTAAYNMLPDSSTHKINMNIKIKHLEVYKAKIDRMSITCNAHSLLQKQLAYYRLDSQVSAIDSYIAAIQHRRMKLVVHAKQRSQKSVYSLRAHFPNSDGCTSKTALQKKRVQFSIAFTRPLLRSCATGMLASVWHKRGPPLRQHYFSSINSITALSSALRSGDERPSSMSTTPLTTWLFSDRREFLPSGRLISFTR